MIWNSVEQATVERPTGQRMKYRHSSPTLKSLAIVLGGLILALPLLGMDCEMACTRAAASSAIASNSAPAEHCPAHGAATPTRRPDAPATPDGCGHHSDLAALKKGIENAEKGSKFSTVAATPPASAGRAFHRISISVDLSARAITPQHPTALALVLRL